MSDTKIRPVAYRAAAGQQTLEVSSLGRLRRRGGSKEFSAPQRLDFDLLLCLESGTTTHWVDFLGYALQPGDVLWVRAGQVHRWGDISAIDGPALIFTPQALDDDLHEQSRPLLRTHYQQVAQAGSPLHRAVQDLQAASDREELPAPLRQALLSNGLARVLLELTAAEDRGSPISTGTDEAYRWFLTEIDTSYRSMHRVSQYADRLGYSTKTLNRLSQRNAGMSAKQLIDARIVLESKRLLIHGARSITEVAGQLGFLDPMAFTKYFTAHVGSSPTAFRTSTTGQMSQKGN